MNLVTKILFLFIIAQIIGIFAGSMIVADMKINKEVQFIFTEDVNDPSNALYFFLYVIAGAVVLILLIRFFGLWSWIFKLLEIIMLSTASSVVFYAFARLFFSSDTSIVLAAASGLVLGAGKFFLPELKNAAAIIATAGVGAIFGASFGIIPVIIFLILLSIYDFAAVFITKHMIEMADFIIKKDLAFTITAMEDKTGKEPKEKPKRIDLGTGDLMAPIMFQVSALSLGPVAVFFVFAGAVISLGLFMFLVFRKGMVLPALPPLTFGMVLFFVIGKLIGFY